VKNEEGVFGWVLIHLAQIGGHDGPPLSFVEPENAYLVTGIVKTEARTPVNGIGFAVTKGFDVNAPHTDATTDDEGRFYAYLPSTLTGTWNVGYVSVSCTSISMDANCNCKSGACGRVYPESVEINLPVNGELVFVWRLLNSPSEGEFCKQPCALYVFAGKPQGHRPCGSKRAHKVSC